MKILLNYFLAPALLAGAVLPVAAQVPTPAPVAKSFAVAAEYFTADPGRHRIYATTPTKNQVVAIDTETLAIVATIPVGLGPAGMALSVDGTKLYVALVGSESNRPPPALSVIDTETLTRLDDIPLEQTLVNIVTGLGNRLYGSSDIGGGYQVNATTGATEAVLDSRTYAGALLQISPDRKTLYVGGGSGPGILERFNVATATPVLKQSLSDNTVGMDGIDLQLSHDGKFLCYSTFDGNSEQPEVDEIDPADFTVRYGAFQLASPPSYITFSPDDKVLYAYDSSVDMVDIFSTATFDKIGSIYVPNIFCRALITDSTGRFLFFSDNPTAIKVYDLRPATSTVAVYGTAGEEFSYLVSTSFGSATFDVTGLPAGLTFDATTRLLSGTATVDGVFPIVITATSGSNTETINLTLTLYPAEKALNISTRLDVQTGDNVGIAGFILLGGEYEQIVVRALGPSLKVNGQPLPGLLANPTLQLMDSTGRVIDSNDDWSDNPEAGALLNFGLAPADSSEAALFDILPPGEYTAVVSGVNGTTGVGLAEVYDVGKLGPEFVAPSNGLSRLANISTRGKVMAADKVMIGGVIVDGTADATILVRALGPSLGAKGVSDPLADPLLGLFDANGTEIASNNNWKDSQETEIEATGLAPKNALESAILATLSPAPYTAVMSGVGEATGVGLVEVYNLP